MSPLFVFSQEQALKPQFFIQTKLDANLTEVQINELKVDLSQNPNVFMVRIDEFSHTLYLITVEMDALNESVFKGWIAHQEQIYSCYYQGIHRIDSFKPFDDKFCED